jgi:tape measure domain-containing protein
MKFMAAVKGTPMEGKKSVELFDSITKASSVLGLGSERLHLIFLALQQMVSKGRVQSEELRRQLSESLPGAFKILADAMGVTQIELNRMLTAGDVMAQDVLPLLGKAVEKAYGIENLKRIDNVAAAQGRYNTALTETIGLMEKQGTIKEYYDFISNALIGISNAGALIRSTIGMNLKPNQYDAMLVFGKTGDQPDTKHTGLRNTPGKPVSELLEPFDRLSNQYIKDHVAVIRSYFMSVFEAEGESMKTQEGLWKAYYKRRFEDSKVMNEKTVKFVPWTPAERAAKDAELARLKKFNEEILQEEEDFNGKRSEIPVLWADIVADMDKKIHDDKVKTLEENFSIEVGYNQIAEQEAENHAKATIKDNELLQKELLKIKILYTKKQLLLAYALMNAEGDYTDKQVQSIMTLQNAIDALENDINKPGKTKKNVLLNLFNLDTADMKKLRDAFREAKELLSALVSYQNSVYDNMQKRLDNDYAREQNRIEKSHKSQAAKTRELDKLDKQHRQKQYELDLKKWKTDRDWALTQTIIYAALATIKLLAEESWVGAGLAAAAGIVGVGEILGQAPPEPPGYKKGGLPPLKGQNGTLIRVNENGEQEAMITAGAVRKFPRQLNAINIAGGGDPLFGGYSANASAQGILTDYQMVSAFESAIARMPEPVLGFKEFNEAKGKFTRIAERAKA